jgi:transketolase
MTVLVPVDGTEAQKAVRLAADIEGPVYIRITRNEVPQITDDNTPFDLKPVMVREGKDVCLFACGVMVGKALEAAEILENEGVSAKVVNVRCLKPLDEETIIEMAKGIKAVVACEEHSIIGGLGSAVAMALANEDKKLGFIAIADKFGQSAHSANELMEFYGLTARHIAGKAKEILCKARDSI